MHVNSSHQLASMYKQSENNAINKCHKNNPKFNSNPTMSSLQLQETIQSIFLVTYAKQDIMMHYTNGEEANKTKQTSKLH